MTEEEAIAAQQRMFAEARARMNSGTTVASTQANDSEWDGLLFLFLFFVITFSLHFIARLTALFYHGIMSLCFLPEFSR